MPYESEKEKKNKEKYGSSTGIAPGSNYKGRHDSYKKEEEQLSHHLRDTRADYSPLRIKEETVISSRLVPRVEDDRIKPLRLISSEVIGGIFDRVNFLQKRIDELKESVHIRATIHEQIAAEIEKDIEDRMQFLLAISDINERRNLKLDISVLRKERRGENVQYWRDLVELNTELRKLEEEFEIETKIAGIFKNFEGEKGE
ncbi:MAG: hypothetical protein J4400_02025 [Candidatus Aenigmarchaeota archaeon]|nr:hypothetical protein [Candidatus Aenigmarchaeota archaeon]